MNITINTDVLQEEHLTIGEFLVMLMGFYNVKYKDCHDSLVRKGIISIDVFDKDSMVLSDNMKNWITYILMKSDQRVCDSGIDFKELAAKLQSLYPRGCKPGTTYSWGGDKRTIAQKLMALIAMHGFTFTEEEAIRATEEHVRSFKENRDMMPLLKYFILRTKDGQVDSMFMTIIENNR